MSQLHEGRNVRRFRELLGIKPATLAELLGEDWNAKKISLLEQKENIGDDLLTKISDALKIPIEAIKNLDDEKVINIFSNNSIEVEGSSQVGTAHYNECKFELTDKLLQAYELLRQAYDEKIEIYKLMIKDKEDMIKRYEKMMNQKPQQPKYS